MSLRGLEFGLILRGVALKRDDCFTDRAGRCRLHLGDWINQPLCSPFHRFRLKHAPTTHPCGGTESGMPDNGRPAPLHSSSRQPIPQPIGAEESGFRRSLVHGLEGGAE